MIASDTEADIRLVCHDRRLARGLTVILEDLGLTLTEQGPARLILAEAESDLPPLPEGVPVLIIARTPPATERPAGPIIGYLHRPIDLDKLEQIIQAQLPPGAPGASCPAPPKPAPTDRPIPHLTPTEQALYRALREADGTPVSREALARLLPHGDPGGDLLTVHICTLRRKLTSSGAGEIAVVRGIGYRLKV